MRQYRPPLAEPDQAAVLDYWVATDSIGIVSDPVPVHPEDKQPSFNELKKKNKRKPHSEQPDEETDRKQPDSDHQIDDYA